MRIALLGDIALIGKYDFSGTQYFDRLANLKIFLSKFDYVVANLETPLTNVRSTKICKSIHLKSVPENVEVIKFLGISAVSLANNHMYDYGKEGLRETIKTLENNGIDWFGACNKTIDVFGYDARIRLSGFCCVSTNAFGLSKNRMAQKNIHLFDKESVFSQLDQDRKDEVTSLLSIHWGMEHTHYPGKYEKQIAHIILDYKNDTIIHGHHPHVIQGIEKYSSGLIAYSLGNLLFDDIQSINEKYSLKQLSTNKQTFVLDCLIKSQQISNYQCHGFLDEDEQGLIPINIHNTITDLSVAISFSERIEYETKRRNEYIVAQRHRMGNRGVGWLMSRLNYNSICAKINFYFFKNMYRKIIREFIDNNRIMTKLDKS